MIHLHWPIQEHKSLKENLYIYIFFFLIYVYIKVQKKILRKKELRQAKNNSLMQTHLQIIRRLRPKLQYSLEEKVNKRKKRQSPILYYFWNLLFVCNLKGNHRADMVKK